MTLLELCEPVFQYVCRLNQSARTGAVIDYHQTRRDVEELLKEFRTRCTAEASLVSVAEETETALIYFVDSMIASSASNVASEWDSSRLAFERKDYVGDQRFFELLDRALADRSEAATQKVGVFYTCMGLGFTGRYAGQSELLRQKMRECSNRIRGMMDADRRALICPDAYHTDTRNLIEKPGRSLWGLGIALAGLTCVLLVAYYVAYQNSSRQLRDALEGIIRSAPKERAESVGAGSGSLGNFGEEGVRA